MASAAHSRTQLYGIFNSLSTSFICAAIRASDVDAAAEIRPLSVGGILLELWQFLHEVRVRHAHKRPLHAERFRLDDARRLELAERIDDHRARDLRLVRDAGSDQPSLEFPLARKLLQDGMCRLALGVGERLNGDAYGLALKRLKLISLPSVAQHHQADNCRPKQEHK